MLMIIISAFLSFSFAGQKSWGDINSRGMQSGTRSQVQKRISKKKVVKAVPLSTQEIAIIHTKDGFYPQKIFLNANRKTKLFITGVTGIETSFIIDEMSIYKGVSSGEIASISFIPKKQGIYKFYCPISNKKGWAIVR